MGTPLDLFAACLAAGLAVVERRPRWRLFWIACGLGFLAFTVAHWQGWI